MKSKTLVNMLLLTCMLSAMGCTSNEAVKKDEGLVPSTQQKTTETRKEVATQPATTTTTATSPATDLNSRQIVPADSQTTSIQQTAPTGIVYFGFDSYALTTESGNSLQAHYNKLAGKPSIQIEGHCDEQGSSEYNLALGEKRAKAAQNYLITLGYPTAKISTISFGKERPAAPGHDEAAWAKNRRAELKIVR